jgi:NTE family protein
MKPLMMEGIGRNLDMKSFYDMTIPRAGFIQGKKIEDLIRLLTKDKSFDELELPLAVTAVDLVSCQRVIITEGKVHKAVRASISIPGIFHPVKDNGRVLVDGGVLERIPVNVVREMGADIVIGVDVGFRGEHKPTNNILEIILQSLEVMELELIKHIVPSEDILICPSLNEISPIRFDQVEECVRLGRAATEEAMPRIKALISNLQTRKMDTSP